MEEYLGVKEKPAEDSFNYKLIQQETRFLTPKAAFFGYPRVGPPSSSVRFQNFSSGDLIRSFWDFGDGSVSTEANPTHTYVNEGIYTIKLNIVTSSGGQGAATKYNYITISEDKKPTFFYVSIQGKVETNLTSSLEVSDDTIYVSDASAFPSQGFVVIGEEQIAYRYKTGTSLKTLRRGHGDTIAAAHASGSIVRKCYYSAQTAAARVASGIEPDAVATTFKFIDQSDGKISTRYWVFGDGESAEQKDPDLHTMTHEYQLPGSYVVTLLLIFSDQRAKRISFPTGVIKVI
jgi:PKD repeat protein